MYTGLLLGSGGVRGYLIIGALRYLLESKQLTGLRHICGVSVGSIIGFLYLIGCLPVDMLRLDITGFPGVQLDVIQRLLTEGYLYSLDPVIDQLKEYAAQHHFENVSFRQLYEYKPIKLTVVAYDVERAEPLYFSHETHPEMPCLEAIRLSCAVPILFDPQYYPRPGSASDPASSADSGDRPRMVIDGGFYTSTPFEVFTEDDRVIALLTEAHLESYTGEIPILRRLVAIFQSLDASNQRLHESRAKCQVVKRVLVSRQLGLPGKMTRRQKDDLYLAGYCQMIQS